MYSTTGAGAIGWYRASTPLASLTATPEALTIKLPFKSITFSPEEIVSIEVTRRFPFIVTWVSIRHNRTDGTPDKIRFSNFGGAAAILQGISESGFVPLSEKMV